MSDVLGLFAHWKDSLSQLIQHSPDLQVLYERCCKASQDGATETTFKNLRSAKHRVETYMTPLSRSILDLTGLLSFAVLLARLRKGTREGRAAETFMETICPTIFMLAGMMGDAGS